MTRETTSAEYQFATLEVGRAASEAGSKREDDADEDGDGWLCGSTSVTTSSYRIGRSVHHASSPVRSGPVLAEPERRRAVRRLTMIQ